MFIGHFAVGSAAKRIAPKTSLGTLMVAPMLLDGLWPIFLLLGWERVRVVPGNTAFSSLVFEYYPYSHSLAMAVVWGLLFAALYWMRTRYGTGAVVIGLAVISHWVLDVVVHGRDLPLYPGSAMLVGFGMWNSVAITLVVEGVMFAAGVWLYATMTKPRDLVGSIALWLFIALLVALYLGAAFGPPPPSVKALALTGLLGWLFPLWAWWIDRHRVVCGSRRSVGLL